MFSVILCSYFVIVKGPDVNASGWPSPGVSPLDGASVGIFLIINSSDYITTSVIPKTIAIADPIIIEIVLFFINTTHQEILYFLNLLPKLRVFQKNQFLLFFLQ